MTGPPSGTTARAYHEATKHSPESVRRRAHFMDWGNRPHPFKVYEGVERVRLPMDQPVAGVSAVEALRGAEPGHGGSVDLASLALLLRYGAGVLEHRRHAGVWFRTYASAGALYPIEVYVVCGELPGLEAGVYHFDPEGFALNRLRLGDHRTTIAEAAGEEAVMDAPATLALAGIPWRTAWKYTERGYRHLFWDAGMMVANLLALCSGIGLPARVVTGFVDASVEELVGLDAVKEFPLLLLPIGRASPAGGVARPVEPFTPKVRPLSRRELVFEAISAASWAGRLEDVEDVRAWRSAMSDAGLSAGEAAPADPGAPADDLQDVIRRRGSAREFAPTPMPLSTLERILRLATGVIPTDHGPSPAIEVFGIANAVDGLGRSTWVYRDGRLHVLGEGDFRQEAGYLCLEQELGADAAATMFLMADLDRLLDRGGGRAYRSAQLEGGIVGGRIYLGAYAHRFGATGLTFYDDAVTQFLGPEAAAKSCMLVVAVGESPRLAREGLRPG
jgi:SagB-type dehydrogenase family enzyme